MSLKHIKLLKIRSLSSLHYPSSPMFFKYKPPPQKKTQTVTCDFLMRLTKKRSPKSRIISLATFQQTVLCTVLCKHENCQQFQHRHSRNQSPRQDFLRGHSHRMPFLHLKMLNARQWNVIRISCELSIMFFFCVTNFLCTGVHVLKEQCSHDALN